MRKLLREYAGNLTELFITVAFFWALAFALSSGSELVLFHWRVVFGSIVISVFVIGIARDDSVGAGLGAAIVAIFIELFVALLMHFASSIGSPVAHLLFYLLTTKNGLLCMLLAGTISFIVDQETQKKKTNRSNTWDKRESGEDESAPVTPVVKNLAREKLNHRTVPEGLNRQPARFKSKCGELVIRKTKVCRWFGEVFY